MSDIFQEVDEDVRRDKAVEFWTLHQNKILAVFVLIVLAVAGFRFYQYEREQKAEATGAAYESALALDAAGKPADAAAAFAALAADAPAGYADSCAVREGGEPLRERSQSGARRL